MGLRSDYGVKGCRGGISDSLNLLSGLLDDSTDIAILTMEVVDKLCEIRLLLRVPRALLVML